MRSNSTDVPDNVRRHDN